MLAARGRRTHTANASLGRVFLVLMGAGVLALALLADVARAPPPIPMTTQGNAYDRLGNPLPVGSPLRTLVDGVDYSNGSSVLNGQGAFSVLTNGSLVINQTTPEPSPVKTGASLGELVTYAAGPYSSPLGFFQEIVPWRPDLTVTQDLHLGSVQSTPEPIRIQGLVTQPARGGPQYVFVCNPTGTSVSLADYYLQVDRPGTFYGGNLTLAGTVGGGSEARVNLTSPFSLIGTGDALKLVYRNPGGTAASEGGRDIVIDRVEFNATTNGSLYWQPGNTTMGNAPAPGPGQILERSSFCSAAPAPQAFVLAKEPGLPAAGPPTVTLLAPSAGENVQGGRTYTIRWNVSDPVFVASYLKVWVNVTVQGTTTALLAGAIGATSVDWSVPDTSTSNALVNVSVVDPFAAHGSAQNSFTILPATPYSAYIAIIVVVVIAIFILLAFYYARRQQHPPPGPPPSPPPEAQRAETAPAAAPTTPAAAARGSKTCPKCGTVVHEEDDSCFFCGHLFVKPP